MAHVHMKIEEEPPSPILGFLMSIFRVIAVIEEEEDTQFIYIQPVWDNST